jgi:hypothetical protein
MQGRPAVFAVLAGNYQPAVSRFRRKSWAADRSTAEITAKVFAVISLFLAVFERKTLWRGARLPGKVPPHVKCDFYNYDAIIRIAFCQSAWHTHGPSAHENRREPGDVGDGEIRFRPADLCCGAGYYP